MTDPTSAPLRAHAARLLAGTGIGADDAEHVAAASPALPDPAAAAPLRDGWRAAQDATTAGGGRR